MGIIPVGKMTHDERRIVDGELRTEGVHPDQLTRATGPGTNVTGTGHQGTHDPLGAHSDFAGKGDPGLQEDFAGRGNPYVAGGNTGFAGYTSGTTGYGTAGANDGVPLGAKAPGHTHNLGGHHAGHAHAGGVGLDLTNEVQNPAIGGATVVEHHHHHLGGGAGGDHAAGAEMGTGAGTGTGGAI